MSHFFPDEWIASAYRIDYEALYREGRRGLIFDIDNTLVPHGAPADARAKALFRRLREIGFTCCLLSNNKEKRVKMFNEEIGIHTVSSAMKPFASGYRRAMEKLGTDEAHTVFIGDQIFTDVWGATRLGIYSILVGQIDRREEIQIVLKRLIEKPVLRLYRRRVSEETRTRHQTDTEITATSEK